MIPGIWQKVTMGWGEAYGLCRDGTLWWWGLDEKSPGKIHDSKTKKVLLTRMHMLGAQISVHNIDYPVSVRGRQYKGVRRNGTLWLETTFRCKR